MSRTFELNKLVRDKVVDDMLRLGQRVVYRQLDSAEVGPAQENKIREEAAEVGGDPKKTVDELVDVLEAAETRAAQLSVDYATLRAHQLARREKRGGFEKQLFVETVTLEDDDEWVDYYAKDPAKYPEV